MQQRTEEARPEESERKRTLPSQSSGEAVKAKTACRVRALGTRAASLHVLCSPTAVTPGVATVTSARWRTTGSERLLTPLAGGTGSEC